MTRTDVLGARTEATIWLSAIGIVGAISATLLPGCGGKLPEPESRPAQLYVQYCSGRGCHSPIPPQSDVANKWKLQTDRMLALMRERGAPLPSPEEEQEIREYLRKHALKP
jgi:hypothetical protein